MLGSLGSHSSLLNIDLDFLYQIVCLHPPLVKKPQDSNVFTSLCKEQLEILMILF
jgi:hypothetical protein